jgi:acrylyl-CoA reductase (NADPH)
MRCQIPQGQCLQRLAHSLFQSQQKRLCLKSHIAFLPNNEISEVQIMRSDKMGFNAILVEKDDEGKTSASVQSINVEDLPEGNVTIAVEYSTVNYKDGLCVGPGGGLVRNYPHIPGIDFAGTVEASDDDRYKAGDKVVLTGWRVGEAYWGGYSQKARVNADWLVPLPDGITTRQAMAVGTAGFTAMLAVMALEKQGLKPGSGPVLVTGAAGGVGSVATAILSNLGYEVAGVTGRPETTDYLKSLGATQIVAREEINEVVKRPLEKELWSGCIDAVGGEMMARVLGQMQYGASVAAVGLAGGANLPATVIPFLLRGVNILGIDSVMQPYENRVAAWKRVATDLPMDKLEAMIVPAKLSDLPQLGRDILKGQIKGRVVVDVNQD